MGKWKDQKNISVCPGILLWGNWDEYEKECGDNYLKKNSGRDTLGYSEEEDLYTVLEEDGTEVDEEEYFQVALAIFIIFIIFNIFIIFAIFIIFIIWCFWCFQGT